MRIPTIRGVIDRRMLVNYRVDPEVLARFLPEPFRPQRVADSAIAGICLIRLAELRPRGFPRWTGLSFESAAHRIAVEWERDGELVSGVYVPRRDTSSRWAALAGGRVFPGVHHHTRFEVEESANRFRVAMRDTQGRVLLEVDAELAGELGDDSVFAGLEHASRFFEAGSLGYSPARRAGTYDGLELRTLHWNVEPLRVHRVTSAFFEDRTRFPEGSVAFDDALLMRDIPHEWHGREPLCCS